VAEQVYVYAIIYDVREEEETLKAKREANTRRRNLHEEIGKRWKENSFVMLGDSAYAIRSNNPNADEIHGFLMQYLIEDVDRLTVIPCLEPWESTQINFNKWLSHL